MGEIAKCEVCGKAYFVNGAVTISSDEYERLKDVASEGQERRNISRYRAASKSPIARNPEMADFILESLVTMTVTEIANAATEKFGPNAPSRSAIYRFVEQMKLA